MVFAHTCSELQQLMQDFAPRKFMERRNIEHVKLSDAEIMALMLLKTQYHVPTWTAFFVKCYELANRVTDFRRYARSF